MSLFFKWGDFNVKIIGTNHIINQGVSKSYKKTKLIFQLYNNDNNLTKMCIKSAPYLHKQY